MEEAFSKCIKSKKIPVPTDLFENLVRSHPLFPSLAAIANVFERLGIEYAAFPVEMRRLQSTHFPCVLHFSAQGGQFVYTEREKDFKQFQSLFGSEPDVIIKVIGLKGNWKYDKHRIREFRRHILNKWLFRILFISAFCILAYLTVKSFSVTSLIMFITALSGGAISYLLIAKEFGVRSKAVETLCGQSEKVNCDKVLQSDYGNILGLKMSDFTVAFFVFQIALLSFASLSNGINEYLPIILIYNLISIPFLFYSIYLQKFKIKVWCRLCLAIATIIILQTIILFKYPNGSTGLLLSPSQINALPVTVSIFLLAITVPATLLIINTLAKLRNLVTWHEKSSRIVHTESVFTSLLKKQVRTDYRYQEPEIQIGNPDTPLNVLMICNLTCAPCNPQHAEAERLVSSFPEKINLTIRFKSNLEDENSTSYLINYWLENYYNKPDASKHTKILIETWFKLNDFESFKRVYPRLPLADNEAGINLAMKHNQWIHEQNINTAPTFLINGYHLPKDYDLSDLFILVPFLTDKGSEYYESFVKPFNYGKKVERLEVDGLPIRPN